MKPNSKLTKLWLSLMVVCLCGVSAITQTSFDKTFDVSPIAPGSSSTLTFTIDNTMGAMNLENMAFTDVLPTGTTFMNQLVIAAGPNVQISNCGDDAAVSAPPGGTTIVFTNGRVPVGGICQVSVTVTTPLTANETYTNTSGDLTFTGGMVAGPSADLDVIADRPGFTKSFDDATLDFGETTTLTFTVDNSANGAAMNSLSFTDVLPTGLVVASTSNVQTTCTNTNVAAIPGSNTISVSPILFGSQTVPAMSTCAISVEVEAAGVGTFDNVSGSASIWNNFFQTLEMGKASDRTVSLNAMPLHIIKRFTNDPAVPGGTVDLEINIKNFDRSNSATAISFTDNLEGVISGLAPSGALPTDPCGVGSMLSFNMGVLTLSGGNLGADGGECTFVVTLDIPAGAAPGEYVNTTSAVTGDVGGSGVTGNDASGKLFIQFAPTLAKTFLNDPILAGGTSTLEFTITNTDPANALTDINFTDNISAFLSGADVSGLPATGSCGAGSLFFTSSVSGDLHFQVSSAQLPAGGSCTFSIDLTIPTNVPAGIYTNTTDPLTATLNGQTTGAPSASADLEVLALPRLSKSFTDDPVEAGNTVTLEFTITYDEFATGDATNINFTDDLNAVIPGMAAVGLPLNDVCGTGSQLSGTTNLSLTGGTLSPGGSCTFSIQVQVPAGTNPGLYTNTTSGLGATVGGQTGTAAPATDDFLVGGLTLSKEFIDGPYFPGDLATLRFTIDNTTTFDATNIFFTDNLGGILPGLAAEAPLPVTPCGAPTFVGTTLLIYAGGTVTAGTSCTFDVPVRIPISAPGGIYTNTTSNMTAVLNGTTLILPIASDNFEVITELIILNMTKEFTNDPVLPGGQVDLKFSIDNTSAVHTVTNIGFEDDLDGLLTGLAPAGALPTDPCGVGSMLVFSMGKLTLNGGELAPGANCMFTVTLDVPATVSASNYENTTGELTGESDVNGNTIPVTGGTASDVLRVRTLSLEKEFLGTGTANGSVTMRFTLQNLDAANLVTNINFFDELDNMLPGATVLTLPSPTELANCGESANVSATNGGERFNFMAGDLAGGGSCSFDVVVQLPCEGATGMYPNITSDFTGSGFSGQIVAPPAEADLDFTAAPTLMIGCPSDPPVIEWTAGFNLNPVPPNTPQDPSINTSTYGVATATGGCGTVTITYQDVLYGPVPGDCPNLWTVQRTWTASDEGTQVETCVQTFTFSDTTPPTIACPADDSFEWPLGFNLNSVPPNTPQDPYIDPSITGIPTTNDNCAVVSVTYQDLLIGPDPNNCPDLWIVERTWTATDACGLIAECVQTFTFTDTTPPTIDCPDDPMVIEWPAGFNTDPVGPNTPQDPSIDPATYGSATATDNCGTPTVTYQDVIYGPVPGDCPNLWTVQRTWTATDNCNLNSPCVQTFTFSDTTPPAIGTCPPNRNVEGCDTDDITNGNLTNLAYAPGGASVSKTEFEAEGGVASDNCAIVTYHYQDVASGTCPTVVTRTWTVTDACGLTDICTQTINIDDTTPPNLVCKDISVPLTPAGNLTITPSQVFDNVNSSDECGTINLISVSPNFFKCSDEGPNVVTLTVDDNCGNVSMCTATVTIEDFISNIMVDHTDESCGGADDGSITSSATAGGGQLQYSIDGVNFQTSGTFNGLSPGTYTIIFKVFGIAEICEETRTVTIVAGDPPVVWYKDTDNDGYSNGTTLLSCTQPPGFKLFGNLAGPQIDCDDNDPLEFPGQVWYPDADGDDYGATPSVTQCLRPAGHFASSELTENDTDCNDNNAAINPAATEVCNGLDDDCDGDVDEGLSGETYVGNVSFATQAQLDEWPACYSVINGNVTIQGSGITSLGPLSNITHITGNLIIQLTGLTNTSGLDALTTVDGSVTIYFNSSLTSLSGLGALGSVGGNLSIYYNFLLSDCCAIESLISGGGVSGATLIFFNTVGCNSIAEILACPSPSSLGNPDDNVYADPVPCDDCGKDIHGKVIAVFPNPASSKVNVLFGGIVEDGTLELTDVVGRKVRSYKISTSDNVHQIDVSEFNHGVYLLTVKVEGQQTEVRKIVIE